MECKCKRQNSHRHLWAKPWAKSLTRLYRNGITDETISKITTDTAFRDDIEDSECNPTYELLSKTTKIKLGKHFTS